MISLTIDEQRVQVAEGTTIFEAAMSVGIDIPHFCYHPNLSIDGNCRMCAVEVAGTTTPVISCKVHVREGMVVRTNSALAADARRSALEFILASHPLDCPICDCAGECTLQDYYHQLSRAPSRCDVPKVRKAKAVDAGPRVMLDAERCISCTRCIRFCEEVVGRHEIGIIGRGASQQIWAEGTLDNEYSLCTVDLCPVGALTSKDFRFAKRVWFLDSSPTVCTGCATGCNVWIDHENDTPYRIRPRANDSVNGPWMCDYGRTTYKRLTAHDRLYQPTLYGGGSQKQLDWNEALHHIALRIEGCMSDNIAGILSANATLEDNAAFHALFTETLGLRHIFTSAARPDPAFADDLLRDEDVNANSRGASIFNGASLDTFSRCDCCIILGNPTPEEMDIIVESGTTRILLVATHRPHAAWAELALPLAAIEEQEGTLINKEGHMQHVVGALPPPGSARPGWKIAEDISQALDKPLNITTVQQALARTEHHG